MDLGVKVDNLPAEAMMELAPRVEAAGLDEFWLIEDLGLAGGFTQVAAALERTRRVRVGLGIAPAAVRNVAYLAMEVATLARLHPGRFLMGVGHGMPEWLSQVGAHPASLMAALEEVTVALRRLLDGEQVAFHGSHVHLDRVRLAHPPAVPPPVSLGVRGPKGLDLARRIANGTILAEGSALDYIGDIASAAKGLDHRLTVFTWLSVDSDGDTARARLRDTIAEALVHPAMSVQLRSWYKADLTDAAIDALAVAGTPQDCAAALRRLADAGADAVILQPVRGAESAQIASLAEDIRPLLDAG
ncbi:LLM class flavin-dependent oxidoreductase [Thermopolyspora sp. NPDC052614]|uniref:LLM class flavin-dependent oxidoreductase n=1 Tax=Thermopolyspora sp. NPDC052614 TaxID=3155682 RepID=UPI00343EA744